MTTKPFTVADAWRSYETNVLPANAPPIQRIECRSAFYSGALALFSGLLDALDPSPDATDDDVHLVERVQEELRHFAVIEALADAQRRGKN